MDLYSWCCLAATLHSLSSPLSLMMMRLASDCYANHKAGQMMDGLSDRLRRLVWGGALSWITNTFSLVIHVTPLLPSPNLQIHPGYPHQLPLTPHHSPASACHVLGVKGFPPIAHQNGTPPSPAPRTINRLADRDGLGRPRPCTFQGGPPPLQRAAVTDK